MQKGPGPLPRRAARSGTVLTPGAVARGRDVTDRFAEICASPLRPSFDSHGVLACRARLAADAGAVEAAPSSTTSPRHEATVGVSSRAPKHHGVVCRPLRTAPISLFSQPSEGADCGFDLGAVAFLVSANVTAHTADTATGPGSRGALRYSRRPCAPDLKALPPPSPGGY